MPVEAPPAPAAPTAPPPTPAPAAPAERPGVAGMLDSIRADATNKPGAPAPKAGDAPAAPKPPVTPPKPEAEAKPADWKTAPKHFRVEFEKKSETVKALEAKIKEIESKRTEQPGDASKLSVLESKLAAAEKAQEELRGETKTWKERAAQADFTKGEDYEKRFAVPYNREKQKALDEVKHLQVRSVSKDGEEVVRAGTEADFLKALALPPGEQDEFIHAAFGNAAWRVINRINEMQRIRQAAGEATAEHAEKWESNQQELKGKTEKEQTAYEGFLKQSSDAIKSDPELGKYFSPAEDDPEASDLLAKGYEQFDNFKANGRNWSPQERANNEAAFRAMVAAFSPAILREKRLTAKVAELEAELGKYRKTDPGAAPVGGGDVEQPEVKGIAGLVRPPDSQ